MSRKRLRYSVMIVLLLMLAFGTVTYAWITLSTINNIEGMSVTASSGNELQISLDGENYAKEISTEQLELLFDDIRLTDVTSTDGIHFQTGGLTEVGDAIPNENYLTFDIWFQTVEPIHTVYLVNNVSNEISFDGSSTGTYVVSQGVSWTNYIEFLNGSSIDDVVESGTTATYYGSDAIRMSFQELKNEENTMDSRSEDELNTFIFDPSEDESRGYNKGYGAYHYFIQKTRYFMTRPTEEPNTSYRLSEYDEDNPYVTHDNTSLLLTLQETNEVDENGKTYYRGKLRINIWVEGWDADAFDAIDKDHIKIQLQFKLLRFEEEISITD